MRYLFAIVLSGLLLCTLSIAKAADISSDELQQQRLQAVKQYIHYLGRGDYQSLSRLFTSHAVAVSAMGDTDSADHFYLQLFSKTISSPRSKLINIFDGQLKGNMMTAYYQFSWRNPQGTSTSAKFVDLFVFQANSTKIKTVYVFSNQFHEDVFTQTEAASAA